jgi:MoaA/NifB/PqqE/SkfB family radical SAM enzyme
MIIERHRGHYLDWDITNKCNLVCKHCAKGNIVNKDNGNISPEMIPRIVEKLSTLDFTRVLIGGGEPLLYNALDQIIKELVTQGILTGITTNGTLMDEKKAKQLIESGLHEIYFSIDSMDSSRNDFMRGKDSLNKTIEGIKAFTTICSLPEYEEVPYIGLSITISKNILLGKKDIEDLFSFAKHSGLDGMLFVFVQPVCRGKNFATQTDGEYRMMINESITETSVNYKDLDVVLYETPIVLDYLRRKYPQNNLIENSTSCYAADLMYYMTNNLDLYPCHTLYCDNNFIDGGLHTFLEYNDFDLNIFRINSLDKVELFNHFRTIKSKYLENPPLICTGCKYISNCHAICRLHHYTGDYQENLKSWIPSCVYILEGNLVRD